MSHSLFRRLRFIDNLQGHPTLDALLHQGSPQHTATRIELKRRSVFKRIVLSDDDQLADAKLSRYRDYLGHEFDQVIIDCRHQLHVDAIAALTGTIVASGELVLISPEQDSVMFKRLRQHWQDTTMTSTPSAFPDLPTQHQQQLVESLQDTAYTHLLIAQRGRGKSHSLGLAVQQLTQRSNQRIIITAPRKANAQVLLRQAPSAQFVAWDKLLQQQLGDALLVIDEAAGIPMWALQRLIQSYTPWIMASTVEGYEGCGRGFAIHFADWLKAHNSRPLRHHQLNKPIRWPNHDPLERWLSAALLLAPSTNTNGANINSTNTQSAVTTATQQVVHASELSELELHQAFELLLEAHYQSSPNDLALLLDDSKQRLTIERIGDQIVGVIWLSLEGNIEPPLSDDILAGRRRPKGNLAPQSIGYFLQQHWALTKSWCRIVRIAVAPAQRRQGIASQLIATARQWLSSQAINYLATSFGYSDELYQFWLSNDFAPIRMSTALDRVSARYPMLMGVAAKPDEQAWPALIAYGQAELAWVLRGELKPLPNNLVVTAIQQGFQLGHLSLASAHFALLQHQQLRQRLPACFSQLPLAEKELCNQLSHNHFKVENRQQLTAAIRQLMSATYASK